MKPEYWQKQVAGSPLFPNVLWERPERRDLAGSLLIVGGSSHGVFAPAEAYQAAVEAGIGSARVLVPESLRKVTKHIPNVIYGKANEIGSFSHEAKDELIYSALNCDGVLLAGDLGRNSETSILITELLRDYGGYLTVTKDAVDLIYADTKRLLSRENTLLVVSFSQLQRLAKEVGESSAFTFDLDLLPLIERLHEFSLKYKVFLMTKHRAQLFCCVSGKVVSTDTGTDTDIWRVETAARAATYLLHHPNHPLEAITSSVL